MKGWLLLTLGVLAQPASAAAQLDAPHGPALNWVRAQGAEACITASELAQRVEARLERAVFTLAQDAELSFDGLVQTRPAGGFSARLAVSNARGEVLGSRDVESEGPDCRALDDALVLITALTLFPNSLGLPSAGIALDADTSARLQALFGDEPSDLDPSALPPQPSASPVTAVEPPADATPDPSQPPRQMQARTRSRKRVAIEAAPVAAIGVLPDLAWGVTAELTLRLAELWPARVGFAHFFERDARAEGLASGVGHFERDELTLFACPLSSDAALAFELCTGAAFGVMTVTSEGFADDAIDDNAPVFDIGGQAGARARVWDALSARLTFTALLPIVQNSYEFQALDASNAPLFRTAQVGLRLQLSLGAEF